MGCSNSSRSFIHSGVLDLEGVSISNDSILNLDGDWEFYENKFLDPIDPNETQKKFMKVPSVWGKEGYSNFGYATYRIHVKNNINPNLGMSFDRIGTAYRVFLNEEMIFTVGSPGTDSNSSSPKFLPDTILLFTDPIQDFVLTIHISNFHDRKGGIWSTPRMGNFNDLLKNRERSLFIDFYLFGSLSIIGFYHLGLFILRRKDKTPLMFGVFCLLIGFRSIMTGEHFLVHSFPDLPWEIFIKMDYLTFYLGTPFFIYFLIYMFPEDIYFKINRFFSGIFLLLSLLVLVSKPVIFSFTLPFVHLLILLTIFFTLYICIHSVIKKKEGAKTFFGALLIFIGFVSNDILKSNGFLNTSNLAHLGFFIFVLSQSFILSIRYSRAFNRVEELSEELETRVEIRTKELNRVLKTIKKDLKISQKIQKTILNHVPLNHPKIDYNIQYLPMTEVGGDLYSIHEISPNSIRIFLADATGHGVHAALMMMTIYSEYSNVKNLNITPGLLLSELGRQYYNRYKTLKSYFSCVVIDIDLEKNEFVYSSAGHPAQVFIQNGEINFLNSSGAILGFREKVVYYDTKLSYSPGDKIVLFSDGLFEVFNIQKEEFGEERIYNLLKSKSNLSSREISEHLISVVKKFRGEKEQMDDITLLSFEFLNPQS